MAKRAFTATGAILKGIAEPFSEERFRTTPDLAYSSAGRRGWTEITLTSREPLHGELEVEVGIFRYPFLLRRGTGGRGLLVGPSSRLVVILLNLLSASECTSCPGIDVVRLVRDSAERPTDKYVLGAVFARVEGYGKNLRIISLYGEDLASTELFRSLLASISPYRVTLKTFGTGEEILSVGSRGELNFMYSGSRSLDNIDAALSFLNNEGYIEWEGSYFPEFALRA